MDLQIKESGEYKYVDEGEGQVLLLLHGLFGALSNWEAVVSGFSPRYRVVIPLMPIYEMPYKEASVDGLSEFIEGFIAHMHLRDLTLLGNSLGGHIGLIYTLNNPHNVRRLVLTGSSGLFENSLGGSFPKRGSYDYIRERVEYTFYNPKTATKELVDEVFDITSSISKCMNIVAIAKSAQRHNMAEEVTRIQVPTLLVWGLNDTITPPYVAHEFHRLMPHSEVRFIDHCCHAPMMEQAEKFNRIVTEWIGNEQLAEKEAR